jgi:hypothetical protein
MAKTLQLRRYPTTTLSSITGANAEIIIDTTLKTVTVHDGATAGGTALAKSVDLTVVFAQSNTVYLQSNTSFAKANNALANTSGALFGGNLTVTGNLLITQTTATANSLFGYGAMGTSGSGYVTQTVSRQTAVSINRPTGQISLFSQAMGINTSNTFILTNNLIAANDYIMLNHFSAGTLGGYVLSANTSAGQANVTIRNVTNTALAAEAPVIQFLVIKATA